MLSMGNQELETERYGIRDFDYFSFPLILGLSSSNEHSLKYIKQHLVLRYFCCLANVVSSTTHTFN